MILKKLLPKSLFGRALLILVLPTVLIQLVVAYVFFDRHLADVTRHMASNMAGEIAFFVHQLKEAPYERRKEVASDFKAATGIQVFFDSHDSFDIAKGTQEFRTFQNHLHTKIKEPITVRRIDSDTHIEIRIQLEEETLRMEMTAKRLESKTTRIFLLWMLTASVVFLLIAIVFLRNQIKPITQLAEAADSFGRGIDSQDFRPHGALEVRRAARAFIVMRERIKRQMRTRTEMLAGISHDLRTPLTRIKLQLAMLEDSESTRELNDDVHQMEHMIQEYLDFARGEGREEAIRVNLQEMLEEVVNDYRRGGARIHLASDQSADMDIRVSAFRRMLHNVIDNALRYGKSCEVSLRYTPNRASIVIDDDGPGIPETKREEVFKPFSRLDPSRNVNKGGVGLGLTIARDIVLAHGGAITLDSSPKGGLRVIINLPL